ncbi:MAG: class I SAM-dependent methyltransferase [Acidimicrobiia bacterium]|nr:class I SAM-dependent methyltransferase [Acidimicrobiia bacterium]
MTDDRTKREATAWFDPLYDDAQRDPSGVPWARMGPCPAVEEFLSAEPDPGRAVVVGCGLGDDAAALAAAGWDTTAFDISPEAIAWCRDRFGDEVDWRVADLFDLPPEWERAFDLVVEVRTIQSLPPALRAETLDAVASLVGRRLLLVTALRPHHVIPTGPPWAVSEQELEELEAAGLEREDVRIAGSGPGANLTGTWIRP